MIHAVLCPNKLVLTGHAGDAPKGENLYCAAASILVATAAAAVVDWRDEGFLEDCEICLQDGFAYIWFLPREKQKEKLYECFRTVIAGFGFLEKDGILETEE